jgi:hypothetical protein
MTGTQLEERDPTFVADLQESERARLKVAAWLRSKGRRVEVPPLRVRPCADQRADFADHGDLFVDAQRQRVEVRWRNLDFTSAADFPFPTVLLGATYRWDDVEPKPVALVLTNRTMSHCLIVPATTRARWRVVRLWRHGRWHQLYAAPVVCAHFFAMEG